MNKPCFSIFKTYSCHLPIDAMRRRNVNQNIKMQVISSSRLIRVTNHIQIGTKTPLLDLLDK